MTSHPSSNLFALECLATTAGRLHENEKAKLEAKSDRLHENKPEEQTNKVSVVQMGPMSESIPSTKTSLPSLYSTFPVPPSVLKPFPDISMSPPFTHSPFRNPFLDMMPPMTSTHEYNSDMLWPDPNLTPSSIQHEKPDKPGSSFLNKTPKSAFNMVPKRPNEIMAPTSGLVKPFTSTLSNIPQQPPMLFRIDQPNNNSLLETLVQESQKLLSTQNESSLPLKAIPNNEKNFSDYSDGTRKESEQANKTNDDFKRAREMVLISPQKKPFKKQRTGLHSVSDVKRAYGGPPFKPGYAPPPLNTPESAMCCLYEHTLLKMATRGFWSGDRGPLQDVFRLTRVENSDLQYNMKEITQHCYNVVKRKLDFADGEKEMMKKHMRNYVDEFDSYLERIYPVSSIAINLYLPTASDYAKATWHGIVPTGWSEYRRAVVIREVFEVLFHLSSNHESLPEYQSSFFDKKEPDKTLLELNLNNIKNEIKLEKENENKTSGASLESEETDTDQNNNVATTETNSETSVDNKSANSKSVTNSNSEDDKNITDQDANDKNDENCLCSALNIKYSRAFEALWRRTAPEEPRVIYEEKEMRLCEYFERFPIEIHAPSEKAVVIVNGKKYKAKNILGFFRRGVQLVDYTKDSGSMVIDTISTIRNVTPSSAVRKIPPGRISKLVHPDLHLENYTNAILQIGQGGASVDENKSGSASSSANKVVRMRRKRTPKNLTPPSGGGREEKLKRKRLSKHSPKEDKKMDVQLIPSSVAPELRVTSSNDKLESIESFCQSFSNKDVILSTSNAPSDDAYKHHGSVDLFNINPSKNNVHSGTPVTTEFRPHEPSMQTTADYNIFSASQLSSARSKDISDEAQKGSLSNQYTQTYDPLRTKPEIPSMFSPDILSPMFLPQPIPAGLNGGTASQHLFSLHLMIDSYRRAAKYLMDTANHLELVARQSSSVANGDVINNNNGTTNNENNSNNSSPSPFAKREPREPPNVE